MKKKRDVERLNPEVAGVPESRGPSQGLLEEKGGKERVEHEGRGGIRRKGTSNASIQRSPVSQRAGAQARACLKKRAKREGRGRTRRKGTSNASIQRSPVSQRAGAQARACSKKRAKWESKEKSEVRGVKKG